MKKLLVMTMLLFCGMTAALAQKPAEIKFDKLTHRLLIKRWLVVDVRFLSTPRHL